ncbi:ABC transporter substrate-binding protein [Melaminivora suipulveris]|uniref:ABC transporter substrate-binding protein n=1 Tax=Melaminivora suipulveris TaxID=2109913 RepID=UPI001F370E5A|nr:ABC transporter substrate-binding protein [Melaminivora suipulveris]
MAQSKGFTLQTFPYPAPGTEQASAWSEVRRFQPDQVLIWGAGPGQAVSVRGAISNGIAPKKINSVVWLAETDMQSFRGNSAEGVKRVTLVNPGSDSAILKRIQDKVVKPGQGSGDAKLVGSTYYNIGVASMALPVQAAKLALAKQGAPLTAEKIKAGYETIKDFNADGLMPPITITAEDHQDGGWGRVSEWKGGKWVNRGDWTRAYQDDVWKLIKEIEVKGAAK